MGDHHVWDVCVMVKAHTTINIEQSAVFSTGEYILRIENLNEGHTILPIHKFISGVFTLLNENRQAINVMEFEVKRNSAFEKHFKIAATDFFIDAQGEQCEVVVANSNESKCLFIQLQLTSHSNVNKMFVGAKIKAFKENQVVQVLHSNASQNKIEQQRVLARTSSTIKHAFIPDKEPKPPQIISSTTPSVVSPALTHSNLTAHTSSYSLEPLPSPVIEHIVPSSPCPGVPPQHACAMDASTNTTPTSTLSTSQQVMTYQPATVTPSHTYPTIMGRTHNGTYSDVDDNTTAPSDTSSNPSDISSTGSGDEMQTSMIYFKAFKLHRKNSQLDTIQLTEKGNYVLVIERQDTIKDKLKNIQNISFSCHWVLSVCGCGLRETKVIKESFNNSALGGRKKIVEEFTLTYPLAALKVELNGHCTLGSIGVVVTLTRTKFPKPDSPNNGEVAHARSRTQGELVWAVSSIEIGRQTSRCFSVEFTQSGRYYFVVEKLDKTYGSTRELGVKGILHTHNGNSQCEVLLFEHSVGGNKNKPLKWKSEPFLAPASSTLELNVQSFALIGNITFSLRLRKVPGLSAEQEKLHQQVVFGILLLGGFFLLNVIFRILNWVLDLGVHLNCLLFSVKITLGHLILLISLVWLKSNRAIVLQQVAKMQDKFEQVFYKFKTISSISNRANIYDFIKKVKAMSRAGKLADKVRWEQEKMANIHE